MHIRAELLIGAFRASGLRARWLPTSPSEGEGDEGRKQPTTKTLLLRHVV
jgi:hypothetical protein